MSSAKISSLRNLGNTSSEWLEAAGITTPQELETLGAAKAYLAVKQAGFRPTLNLLWSLAGAIIDVPWNALPPEVKRNLLQEVAKLEEQDTNERDERRRRRTL